MTSEEMAVCTGQEQAAGRNATRDNEAKLKDSRGMKGRDTSRLHAFIAPSTAQEWAQLPVDPDVKLPADVRASIARGEAKFQELQTEYKGQRRQRMTRVDRMATAPSIFITSVVDQEVQDRRDAALSDLEKQSEGKRGQPPKLVRLRVAHILVDRHRAEGVPFATGRNSRMNKLLREDLNQIAARSRDHSKSRSNKQLCADAVRRLLRQIKDLGD